MYKFLLPNNKPINMDMVLLGLEDSDINNHYFLDSRTGEVEIISEFAEDDVSERLEKLEEERYIAINPIPKD